MKTDKRKEAVFGAILKDSTSDWKNIANKEIEENRVLKDKIATLQIELDNQSKQDILEVDPTKCCNWKYADRNKFELGNIEELADDIKMNGQLQPVILRRIESLDYLYEVIAGERRWRACLLAGVTLKAILTNEDEVGCMIIQSSENKKKSLSPFSLAVAYEKLMKDLNISQNELARRLNLPKTSLSELMAFNKVPKEVWVAVEDMSKVKPRTAAFLSTICLKGDAYIEVVIKLAPMIKDGMGAENISKLIDKSLSNTKTNRSATRVYESQKGEVLFRITTEGRISLSKSVLKKTDLNTLTDYLGAYLENNV
ncbi:ParB/RepB/Spo0J family partition protein [Legionella saoudiensis]|jgi:ParB family chromosome partitioning protein|uniref:ParB/RepB/Spo0J family partition protein n=1 Tax=Legionella saoudiensis TaxID=1750561 RepID=UPI000731B6CD|nr:ParB/RepB/Spo0J family partition protein [Legionella saoudiensis]